MAGFCRGTEAQKPTNRFAIKLKTLAFNRKDHVMSRAGTALLILITGLLVTTSAAADTPMKELRVYGPGGPHQALQECAERFEQESRTRIQVIKALPHDIERRLPEDGDIYYGGAEYMLEDFNRANPGVLRMDSVKTLLPRQIGILVRKGNPLNIKDIDDLKRADVDLLDVKLENMRHFYSHPDDTLRNVRRLEYTGRQGTRAWRDHPELDAWVTYKSWHVYLSEESDFIAIPHEDALRHIPVALAERTEHSNEAMEFIRFLQSEEAKRIFTNHGWN